MKEMVTNRTQKLLNSSLKNEMAVTVSEDSRTALSYFHLNWRPLLGSWCVQLGSSSVCIPCPWPYSNAIAGQAPRG